MLQHINEWYIKYIDMFIQAVNDYELANPSEDATAFVKDLRHEVQKLHNNLRSQKAFLQELLHLFQVANYFGLAVEGKRQAAENEFADMCKILFYLATISLSGEQDLLSLCETALEPAPSLAGIRGQFIMLIQRLISTEYLHCFVRD